MNWNTAVLNYIRQHPFIGHWLDASVVLGEREAVLVGYLPTSLPLQLCQAVGAQPERAIPLSAAFTLFNLASEVLDDFQDQDTDYVWSDWPLERVLTSTLAMMFLAQSCLARLEADNETKRDILDGYAEVGVLAAVGQNALADSAQPSLQRYWHHTQAKSGIVFAVGAWSGARLATTDTTTLERAREFGLALGALIQIADDCRDFRAACDSATPHELCASLPIIVAHQNRQHPAHSDFMALLQQSTRKPNDGQSVYQMAMEMGGVTGALALGKAYEHKALMALDGLGPTHCGALVDYVRRILPTA